MGKLCGIIILAVLLLALFHTPPGIGAVHKSEAAPRDTTQDPHRSDVTPRQEPDEDDGDVAIGTTWIVIGLCLVALIIMVVGGAMFRGLPTLGPTRRRISTRDYSPPPGEGVPRPGVIEPPPAPDQIRRSPLDGQRLPETDDRTELGKRD